MLKFAKQYKGRYNEKVDNLLAKMEELNEELEMVDEAIEENSSLELLRKFRELDKEMNRLFLEMQAEGCRNIIVKS
jgi:hypothetical protein